MNWLPGVSQLKSVAQLVTGDVKGALATQKDFLQQCPGVSQLTSVGQLLTGDVDGAIETQKKCLGTVNKVANNIPVVGHVKGAVHYALNDEEAAKQAIKCASRTTAVVASGAGGFCVAGPVGAFAAGTAAGAAVDSVLTAATGKEHGHVATLKKLSEEKSLNSGELFDLCAGVAMDGFGNSVVCVDKSDKPDENNN